MKADGASQGTRFFLNCCVATLVLGLSFQLSACGAGAGTSGGTSALPGSDQVIERAEGFSERPAWADANNPFSRRADQVRVVGFVDIDGDQRIEAGFRAADSYARAELVRFLSTRIVAVLKETLSSDEAATLSEVIHESATALIDDISITAHYWERVPGKDGERLHLYSRADIDRKQIARLLAQIHQDQNTDFRTPLSTIQKQLEAKWDAIGHVQDAHSARDLLPEGTYLPDWAKDGDSRDDREFRFVCHGLAANEEQAQVLAKRMCTEKLCRLFGVQIKAQTTVREDLNGIEAESEVSEGCLDVHIEGRKTEFSGGECGPRGCVEWIMQSYPKSAYVDERRRLENPTLVERQVVVQEGSIKYKDPAVCESKLKAYGRVEGVQLAALQERISLLTRAQAACQGIDPRESGLFERINALLQDPLWDFVYSSRSYSDRFEDNFLYGDNDFRKQVSTARFFDQRIKAVIDLLKNALLPIAAYEALTQHPQDRASIQKAVKPLYSYPFGGKKIKSSHLLNVHAVHRFRKHKFKDEDFAHFLMQEARERKYGCSNFDYTSGYWLIRFLARYGSGGQQQMEAILSVIRASSEQSLCLSAMIRELDGEAKRKAMAIRFLDLVVAGQLQVRDGREKGSPIDSLKNVLSTRLEKETRLELALRYLPQLKGDSKQRQDFLQWISLLFVPRGANDEGAAFARYLEVGKTLASRFDEFSLGDLDQYKVCSGLAGNRYTPAQRRQAVLVLKDHAKTRCRELRAEDWPYPKREVKRPEPPASAHSNKRASTDLGKAPPREVARLIGPQFKSCFYDTDVYHPTNGKLPTWVVVKLEAGGSRWGNIQVDARIKVDPVQLKRRERTGFVSPQDIRSTEQNIESCVKDQIRKVKAPAGSETQKARTTRLWLLFTGNDSVSSLYRD